MRRISVSLFLAVFLACPLPAGAATTLGQLDPAAAPGNSCAGNSGWVQSAETGAGTYVVPAGGGVITSWSHKSNTQSGRELALRIWRPTATPTVYTLIGGGGFQILAPSTVNTFAVRLPVLAGDRLGLRVGNPGIPTGGGASCAFSSAVGNTAGAVFLLAEPSAGGDMTLAAPYASNRLNVTAKLEPDADHDGFGDESQDPCPGVTGTANGCAATGGPGTTPGKDTTAPKAKLRARRQAIRQGRVRIVVTPTEDVRISVTGRLPIARAAKVHRLRKVTRTAKANKAVTVRLHFAKKMRRAVRRALRNGQRPRIRLTVGLVDAAGNRGTVRGTLRLKR